MASSATQWHIGKVQNDQVLPYNFSIRNILEESWSRIKGVKATYWGAIGWYTLCSIMIAVIALISLIFFPAELTKNPSFIDSYQQAFSNVASVLLFPLLIGLIYLAIRRSVDLPIRSKQIFDMYKFYWRLLGSILLITLITGVALLVGFFIIGFLTGYISAIYNDVLPTWAKLVFVLFTTLTFFIGIYFIMALSYAPLLIVEKGFGIAQAIKISFRGFNQHWLKIIVLYGIMWVVVAISAIPLFIGLIWTLPMLFNSTGILYRTIFGVASIP